jgi:signal peptidase I
MNKVLKELFSTAVYLLIVLGITYLVITFVGQRTEVEGESMESTLQNGDNLIVDKITYRFEDPKRYDIIVFPVQYQSNTFFIKRIIGLPGETVSIDKDGNIYIDGELLNESYGREIISPDTVGNVTYPVTLGDDEYFVLGDNRNNSTDSRTQVVGNVKRSDIIGRAWVRIWPLSKFGFLNGK